MSFIMAASVSPGTSKGAGGDAEDDRPMTYEEKRTLSLGVNMLNGPLLGRIVEIIQSMEPFSSDGDTNEFEIDFEKLNPATLRALERFIKSKVPSVYEKEP